MAEKSKVSERIVEIDQCFGVSGQTLAVNGRVLIAEGVLTKSCRSGIKARQFFLFNDILVRTEWEWRPWYVVPCVGRCTGPSWSRTSSTGHSASSPLRRSASGCWRKGRGRPSTAGSSTPERSHSRSTPRLEERKLSGSMRSTGWVVRVVRCESCEMWECECCEMWELWDVRVWELWECELMLILTTGQCTTRLLARRDKSPCREFAPLLQPSSSSSSCSSCHLPFSLLVRRRHCKRCGRLTCSECSSNRVLLPSRHNKPLRVCLACYTVLRDIKGDSHWQWSY